MREPPEVISFYSYKGGTGRSLAVAHIADYLSSFGKSVLAIDMDLEAPGLHYKLSLVSDEPPIRICGLVDLMHTYFMVSGSLPETFKEFCVPIVTRDNGGSIRLLPAGDVRAKDYWTRLAQLNWHDLFYSEGAKGLPFFLELLDRLSNEFHPDYILIDARTGITELGGVASTILPDKFVCIFTNSIESLEGTREVLRSAGSARRLPGKERLELFPVLARIPEILDSEIEDELKARARRFLNEPADDLGETLDIRDITVLHSEPQLQLEERVLTHSPSAGGDGRPLMRDYLRLFAQLIPSTVVAPHITNLITRALSQVLEDPDSAEKALEAVANLYPHEESYRALLKFYRLRRASGDVILRVAQRLWRSTDNPKDPLLYEVVESFYPALTSRDARAMSEFAEKVWRASDLSSAKLGLAIARFATSSPTSYRRSILRRTLTPLLSRGDMTEEESVEAIRLAMSSGQLRLVVENIAVLWKPQGGGELQAVVLEALIEAGAGDIIKRLLETTELDLARLKGADLAVYARLLGFLGRDAHLVSELDSALDESLARRDMDLLIEIGRAYRESGRARVFADRVREELPSPLSERLLERYDLLRPVEHRRLIGTS